MDTKYLQIEAVDTLFFRDGKPFSMGEDSYAETIFPPVPSVLYGVLRSIWFADNMDKFEDSQINTVSDITTCLHLKYLSLLAKDESISADGQVLIKPVFPIPNDILRSGDRVGYLTLVCQPGLKKRSSYPFEYITQSAVREKTVALSGNSLLKMDEFIAYIMGDQNVDVKHEPIIMFDEYLTHEYKVGMAREADRTAKAGYLYSVSMRRPEARYANKSSKKLTMLLGYTGLDFSLPAVTRIGADGKTAIVRNADPVLIPKPLIKNEYLKMYLATPGVFSEGWKPDLLNGIEILAAAIGKTQNIGGFDMVKKEPKPMLKAVPAGSVYFLKGSREDLEKLVNGYHGRSICTPVNAHDYAKEGFGIVYFANFHSSQIPDN